MLGWGAGVGVRLRPSAPERLVSPHPPPLPPLLAACRGSPLRLPAARGASQPTGSRLVPQLRGAVRGQLPACLLSAEVGGDGTGPRRGPRGPAWLGEKTVTAPAPGAARRLGESRGAGGGGGGRLGPAARAARRRQRRERLRAWPRMCAPGSDFLARPCSKGTAGAGGRPCAFLQRFFFLIIIF